MGGVQRQAVAVVVQGLLELAFDRCDVSSDVGRCGVLTVNLSGVHVETRGLDVALVEGEKGGFTRNGRVFFRTQALSPAQGFRGGLEFAQHPLCSGETKPSNTQFSVQREGAVERTQRVLEEGLVGFARTVAKTISVSEVKPPFHRVKERMIDAFRGFS